MDHTTTIVIKVDIESEWAAKAVLALKELGLTVTRAASCIYVDCNKPSDLRFTEVLVPDAR